MGAPDVGGLGGEPFEERAADHEQAGAAWGAQELAAGSDEEVTADGAHVYGQLAERLGGVQEEGHAVGPRQRADFGGGFDQARGGRHMGRRDQRGGTGA